MQNMKNFFKNPEYASLKTVIALVLMFGFVYFVYDNVGNRGQSARVFNQRALQMMHSGTPGIPNCNGGVYHQIGNGFASGPGPVGGSCVIITNACKQFNGTVRSIDGVPCCDIGSEGSCLGTQNSASGGILINQNSTAGGTTQTLENQVKSTGNEAH